MHPNLYNYSVQELEGDDWGKPGDENSNLVKRCMELRRKPLNEFNVEDLRLMINQGIGLVYLFPLAVEILTKNVLAEGDLYEGDLLQSVLNLDDTFWQQNQRFKQQVEHLISENLQTIKSSNIRLGIFDKPRV